MTDGGNLTWFAGEFWVHSRHFSWTALGEHLCTTPGAATEVGNQGFPENKEL